MTRRLPPIAAAAVLTAMSAIACSGSPLATAPLAPSALPGMTLSVDTGEADAGATFGALDKGKDKGKGSDSGKGTEQERTTTDTTVVEVEGSVATATGTCPARTFTIGTRSITTSVGTKYEEGVCADLVALAEIKVRAVRQTDGTLVATKVEFKDTDETDDEEDDEGEDDEDRERGNPHHGAGPHDGTVSSFRGACPAVTFNLKGLRISTTAATTYEGGTCGMLRPNVKVIVTGTAGTASRTFVARTITIVQTPSRTPTTTPPTTPPTTTTH